MEFNEGHIIEGCDRVHIILSMIGEFLKEHPAILEAGCGEDISRLEDILVSVYQEVDKLDDNLE